MRFPCTYQCREIRILRGPYVAQILESFAVICAQADRMHSCWRCAGALIGGACRVLEPPLRGDSAKMQGID
jgi:hypothetical protein